jgi:hypothetical protein
MNKGENDMTERVLITGASGGLIKTTEKGAQK